MQLDHCSLLLVITLLNITIRTTMAITGCIVTLMNPTSVRRKVLCADPKSQIESIPIGLPDTTEMLIISQQNISAIEENDFFSLSELKTLLLTFSNLKRIQRNSFKYLTHLVVLDLSENFLTISEDSLPSEIFQTLSELQYLRLTGNPLTFIPDLIFKPLSLNLRKLFLNKCDTPALSISPRAFKGINNMEELDLRESGLTTLSPSMESDLREMKSLKRFLIGGNNFFCDCKLRWFYFYLTQIQETVTILLDEDKYARCTGPAKLSNIRFPAKDERHHLRYIDFICVSQCSSTSAREFVGDTGSSVNLTCECFTDPIQRLSWTKNGHAVEETTNKYRISQSGKESFQSTLTILSLQPLDSGNWSCKIDSEASQNFTLKIKSGVLFSTVASINIYIFVGLGSSLFLISLIVVMVVMFCRREALCQLRSQHPMVICGYESNIRKSSLLDGDIQYRYNQQDGRFNTSFYENTIPFDSTLTHYHRSNHLFPEEIISEKNFVTSTFPKTNNDKMLNMYCGCHYNSDDDPETEIMRSSITSRTRSSLKPLTEDSLGFKPTKVMNSEEKFQQLKLKTNSEIEKLIPNLKQCPFHGSSGTLTRIPGEKPCPVHGSTATLPSRLSSRKVEHRFGCPKHNSNNNRDNISVKSLKMESTSTDHVKPHRCKSVNKLSIKPDTGTEKMEILTPKGYRPCPLHGDVLAAINENIFEPISKNDGVQLKNKMHSKTHSKPQQQHHHHQEKSAKIPALGCDKMDKKCVENLKARGDCFQEISVSISHTLTSPVQSSLSSSPLLTSDVHGTLV